MLLLGINAYRFTSSFETIFAIFFNAKMLNIKLNINLVPASLNTSLIWCGSSFSPHKSSCCFCNMYECNWIPLKVSGQLTFKDGLVVVIGALGMAHLSQLLVGSATGDVSLDIEAVALPFFQIRYFYHSGSRFVHFLQKNTTESNWFIFSCSHVLEMGLKLWRLLLLTLPVLLLFRYVTIYSRSLEKTSLMFSWRPSLNRAVSGSVTSKVIFLLSSLTSSLKSGLPMSAVGVG